MIGTFEKYWSLLVDVDKNLIFLTGDVVSISNLHGFIKSLQHESSQVFEKTCEKGLTLRKNFNKVVRVMGESHFGMSILVNIHKLFQGGLM